MLKTVITLAAGGLIVFLVAYGLGCHKGKAIIQKEYITQITHDTIRDTIVVIKLIPQHVGKTTTDIKQVVARDTIVKVQYKDRIQYVDRDIVKRVTDTITIPANTPILTYKDSVVKSNYTMVYDIRTIGLLDGFNYNVTVKNPPVKSDTKKFFSNLFLGYRFDKDVQVGGQIGFNKVSVNYLYGANSKTHNVFIGYKLF